jgi:hypothetical protein
MLNADDRITMTTSQSVKSHPSRWAPIMSRVKMCFTPSALFQALGPVVTSKLLGVCDIQQ